MFSSGFGGGFGGFGGGFGGGYGGGGYGDEGNLNSQIDMLFNRHDFNRSGYLGISELHSFLNDLLPAMGHRYRINQNQARQILYEIDNNCDGRASRREVKLMYYQIINNSSRYGLVDTDSYGGGYGMTGSVGFGGGGFNTGYGGGFGNTGGFSYNGSWNTGNDTFLRQQIDRVYGMYDRNYTGQLEGQQFCNAYRDLCISVGQAPPADYYSIRSIAQQADTNFDGRVSKMEMFNLFKRCQFNLY